MIACRPPLPVRGTAQRASDFFIRGDESRDKHLWADAASFYEQGLLLDPRAFEIWVQLVHMRKEMGLFDGAEDAYLIAAKQRPENADLQVQLICTRRWETFPKAREHYGRATGLGLLDAHAIAFLKQPTLADPAAPAGNPAASELFRWGETRPAGYST